MDQAIVVAIIAILPQLTIAILAVAAAVRFRVPLTRLIDERVSSVSAFGFKVDLRPAEVDAAVRARLAADQAAVGPPASGTQVVDRATRLGSKLVGRTVLWVDDHPDNNRIERRMLRQMGIFTETATTNRAALAIVADPEERIDLVISDIGRDDGSPDGLALLRDLRSRGLNTDVIFYVGRVDPERAAPPGAFGITARPDELLNIVMDALDRR